MKIIYGNIDKDYFEESTPSYLKIVDIKSPINKPYGLTELYHCTTRFLDEWKKENINKIKDGNRILFKDIFGYDKE